MIASDAAYGRTPEVSHLRYRVESQIRTVMHRYGYQELRLQALEEDVLRGDVSPSLRPDGLPSCVRAVLAMHQPPRRTPERLWFIGPVLWHSPQGPRQTVQFGIVTFNMPTPAIEAELVLLVRDVFRMTGLAHLLSLSVHNLGSWQEQARSGAQRLGVASRQHFAEWTRLLDQLGVRWQPAADPSVGKHYFNHSVFDWRWRDATQEDSLCIGGRCDDLATQLSGRPLSVAGLAIDVEQLMQVLCEHHLSDSRAVPRVSLRAESREQATDLVLLGHALRDQLPGFRIRTLLSGMALDEIPDPVDWRLTLLPDGRLSVWSLAQGPLGILSQPALLQRMQSLSAAGD
ncbi:MULTISPECIES: ATP phosphoribosyltransferase regulatory subunit [unclassified Paludibacterium]|uniref:ATP phosphoribosyltransferase regulatory subunit n=1 Tax=unclassified Paludibacterium TaxID=2618429 RepID=UPI001C052D3A|nr:ATP phosphoribosyltransferase regulatory subunit [Paludibacterium sp. B53371]BEV72729.1 histidine--tRNA ligase [Paludibacterium sp. THUN1379]